MLRAALLGLAGALLGSPALAFNFCDEAWFTRNLIFDRAGYCFGSELGQHVFDNSDCTGTSVTLSDADKATVASLRGEEQQVGCQRDTSRARTLDIPNLAFRMRQQVLPIPDHIGFGCFGYVGAPATLTQQAKGGAFVTTLQPGDDITVFHYNNAVAAAFLTVTRGGASFQGWSTQAVLNEQTCTQLAG